MAKLFRIEKKGPRYIVSLITFLLIIVAVVGVMIGIGFMLDKLGIDWWNNLSKIYHPEKNIINVFTAGLMTCVALLFLFFLGFLCFLAIKDIANECFNSVGDKKSQKKINPKGGLNGCFWKKRGRENR